MKVLGVSNKRSIFLVAILTGVMLIILSACSSDSTPEPTPTPEGTGVLSGTVSIGPLCPVEPCSDPLNPYTDIVIVMTRTDESQSGEVPVNEDGTFVARDVPTGEYFIDVKPCEWLGCSTELPWQVRITPNQTTPLAINIDTGIR